MTSLMFKPDQRAASLEGSVHPDFYRWLLELSITTRLIGTADKTSAYNARPGEVVLCDPTSGAFTVTLPLAKDCIGQRIIVKNNSASNNDITVAVQSGDTIDGGSTTTVSVARMSLTLFAPRGSVWVII